MYYNEADSESLSAFLREDGSCIQRARTVSAFDYITAPVAYCERWEDGTTVARVRFYAEQADLDLDMSDLCSFAFQSAIETVIVHADGTCEIAS